MRITVAGCGRWGSFIAWYLCRIGHAVTLYGRPESRNMQRFLTERCNDYLTLQPELVLSTDRACVTGCDVLIISVGSQSLAGLLEELRPYGAAEKKIVLCMKGLEVSTGRRLSQVVADAYGEDCPVAVWLGPGHVQEFVRGVPNCMVIDSRSTALQEELIAAFAGDLIRFYYGRDLLGNEIGAASKNVIGIAAGVLDGLGLVTLKGALMSRGTREIARLISAMGGNELSAYGLCHLGDYEATVFSPHSHNRRFGEAFVQGEPFTKLAEGCYTAAALMELGQRWKVELPICAAVYAMLYEKAEPRAEIDRLFTRSLKQEF
jgi:glycerol-3-phosphate dehydrogenase (NAD(P)+)